MRTSIGILSLVLLVAACSRKESSKEAGDGTPTTYDLASAGASWKGYTARLPRAGAKVMGDLGGAARVATNGRDAEPFDVAWAPGSPDLANIKETTAAGESVGTKTRFLVENPDDVTWLSEFKTGGKSYHFDIGVSAAGQTFRCYSLPMGVDSEAQLAAHKAACATLTKTP
ncbi:MAG: hypothetical protein H0T42_06390 [Deltaproteobacteria bacterium]|nr:hypothetical protein [Deltaproteobacteria bacterium]